MASTYQQRFYPETRFGGFTRVDGTIGFYMRVNALLDAGSVVLDAGCGRGACANDPVPVRRDLCVFKGRVRRVIGIDTDVRAAGNPFLDEFRLIEGGRWPLDDDSVDLCVCTDVVEHVQQPDVFFSECRRVLRDGGHLCIRTANAWGYPAIAARLIPNRRHAAVLGRVEENKRQIQDIFPTAYRCNSIPRLRALLRRHGFDHVVYGVNGEPSYVSFSWLAYFLGTLHERFSPRFLATALFAFGQVRKPAPGKPTSIAAEQAGLH